MRRIVFIRDEIARLLSERRAEFKDHTDTLIDSERGDRDRKLIFRLQLAGEMLAIAAQEFGGRT